jgi:hypothetical protein
MTTIYPKILEVKRNGGKMDPYIDSTNMNSTQHSTETQSSHYQKIVYYLFMSQHTRTFLIIQGTFLLFLTWNEIEKQR